MCSLLKPKFTVGFFLLSVTLGFLLLWRVFFSFYQWLQDFLYCSISFQALTFLYNWKSITLGQKLGWQSAEYAERLQLYSLEGNPLFWVGIEFLCCPTLPVVPSWPHTCWHKCHALLLTEYQATLWSSFCALLPWVPHWLCQDSFSWRVICKASQCDLQQKTLKL